MVVCAMEYQEAGPDVSRCQGVFRIIVTPGRLLAPRCRGAS